MGALFPMKIFVFFECDLYYTFTFMTFFMKNLYELYNFFLGLYADMKNSKEGWVQLFENASIVWLIAIGYG